MKSCLVVDDSSIVRKVQRRIVENLQFLAVEAEHGTDALSFCHGKGLPDAVLIDCSLADQPSNEVIAQIRALPGGARPYILFCASENDSRDINRAVIAGANDYILKPFTREELRARLDAAGLM